MSVTGITPPGQPIDERTAFVGRVQEQRQFLVALNGLLAHYRRWANLSRQLGPDFNLATAPGDDSYANIFLPHGIGGIGKSWLTRRCLTLAQGIPNDPPILTLYDDVSLGAPILEHGQLLDRLAGQLDHAGYDMHTAAYREAKNALPRLVERVTRYQFENRGQWDEMIDLAGELVARRPPHDGAYHSFADTSLAYTHASAAETAGRDAPTLIKAYDLLLEQMQKAGKIDAEETALFRNPPAALAAKLTVALRQIAVQQPLVIGLDNLEIIVPQEPLIRDCLVLPTNQSPIIWILSGRHNLADERLVDLGGDERVFKGYRDLLGENPPVSWDMSIFGDADLRDYLEAEAERRRAFLLIDDDLIEAIKATSSGVPLVVEMVTDALFSMDRDQFLQEFALDDRSLLPGERLNTIAERFLRYCLTQPDDLERVQAMALLRKGADDDALAAVWRLSPQQPVRAALLNLRTRYAFVMPEGLHDAVYDFVRRQLRTSWQAADARERLSRRALDFYQRRWDTLQAGFTDSTLRVRDPRWQRATRDLLNALLWYSPDQAVLFLLPRFVEGLGFDRPFANGLLLQAEEFLTDSLTTFSNSYANLLHRMRVGMQNIDWAFEEPGEAIGAMLTSLLAAEGLSPLHLSILHLWRGSWLVEEGQLEAGLAAYQQADDHLPADAAGLRQQLAKAYYEISSRFLWPAVSREAVASEPGLQAARRAVELNPDSGPAWFNYAVALDYLERLGDAVPAYQKAIALEPRPNYYNSLGDVFSALRRDDEAIAAYRQALALEPTYAWPYHNLGLIYADRGDFDEALRSYQQAIEYHQHDRDRAVSWDNFGDAHAALGNADESISAYRWAGVLNPRLASPWYGLGNVYAALGRPAEAIEAYQKVVTLEPTHAWAYHRLGLIYAQQGDQAAAASYFRQAIQHHLDDDARALSWNSLGLLYSQQQRPHDAIEAFRRAIKLDPQQADAWHNLGDVYVSLRNAPSAVNAYQQAVEIAPDLAASWSSLGAVYTELGRHDDAIDAYRRVIALTPDDAWAYNNLGYIYSRRGEYDAARDAYQQAIDHHADDESRAVSLSNLGDVQVALNNAPAAIAAYREATELAPDYAWPHHNLAAVYESRGEYEAAISHYRQAIERHTDDAARAASWFRLARVYQLGSRPNDAARAYRQVIALEPDHAAAWNYLGDSYRVLNQPAQAGEAYRQAIDLQADYAAPYHSLGLLATAAGNHAEAEQRYRQAIERESDPAARARSWHQLGDTLLALSRPAEAADAYRQAVQLDPAYARPYYGLGVIAEADGDAAQALGYFQQAIDRYPAEAEVAPEQARAWNGLGNAYHALERLDEAVAAYRRAAEYDDRLAAPWRSLGDVYRHLGQPDEAIESYERTLALDPAPAHPYHQLGLIYEEAGDFNRAAAYFEQALERHPAADALARSRSLNHLGNARRGLDQQDAAIDAYRQAAQLDAAYFAPQAALGEIYAGLEQYEPAIAAYRRAVEIDPAAARPWSRLGDIYRTLENYAEARDAYQQALGLDPALPEPHYGLGVVAEVAGDPAAAQRYYEQAISRFAPAQTEELALAWNGLGDAHRLQQRPDEATAAYRQSVELTPALPWPYHGLGLLDSAAGRPDSAVFMLRQAVDRYPDDPDYRDEMAVVWDDLGEAYSALRRWDAAEDAFQNAIEADPDFALPWHHLANVYSSAGRYGQAVKAYGRAIELDPGYAWAYNNLALVVNEQGDPQQAIDLYQMAIRHHTGDTDRAVSWNNLGDVYQTLRQNEAAAAAYQKAIELDPRFARPWKSLGDVYRAQGRTEGVEEAYQQAINLDPAYAWPYHQLGLIYKQRGDHRQAINYYRQAIQHHQRDEDRAASWNGLGNVYLAQRRYPEATDAFQQAIQLNPADAWPYHNLGFVYRQVGSPQRAIGMYMQAIDRFEHDAHRAVSWNNLGNVYGALARHQEAIDAYRQAIKLNNKYALPWNSLGEIHARQENYEEAAAAFREALQRNGRYVLAWNNLGDALWRLGRTDEAIQAYEQAIALDERFAWPYHNLGLVYDERGDYESAIEYYQQAISRHTNPEQKAVLSEKMGDLYRVMDDTERAIDAYRQATTFDLHYASPWYSLGNIYAALEQDTDAITAYRRAIDLKPEEPWPYHNLALLYEKQSLYREAISLYRQAIERHRTDHERALSWDSLGNVYQDLGRLDEAVEAFRQAIDLQPDYALPWSSLGDVYRALGDLEQAEEAYRQAIGLDPSYIWAYNSLGAVHAAQGEYPQAVEVYRQAIDQQSEGRDIAISWNSLGDIYDTLKREEEAIAAYERAIKLDPDYAWPYNRLGAIFERRGDRDQAMALYRQATRRHRQRTATRQ